MQDPMQLKRLSNLANLARIDINENMAESVMESIDNILSLMDQLQSVSTDGVEPMAHPLDACQQLRKDVITESDQRADLQAIAPAVEDGLFLVPKVID